MDPERELRGAGESEAGARWPLVAFLTLALALRLPGHLNSGLWFDEIWLLVESVRVPFTELFTSFESDNNHPLYGVLAWLSVHAFGEHAWSLRLPAVLFGVASIGMMWKLSRLVTGRAEATLATALLTVSYHHVWFSQNARGYTMLLFFTLAATYFLMRTYERGLRRDWVLYAVSLALATYTHASAVLLALSHAVVSLIVIARRRPGVDESPERRLAPLMGLVAAGSLSLLLHAGMLGDMLTFFSRQTAAATARGLQTSEWTTLLWTMSAVVQSLGVPATVGWAMVASGGALVLLGTAVVLHRDWRVAALYLLPAIMTVATTIGLGRSLRPRFVFHLAGFGLLIVVASVFALCTWIARRIAPEGPVRIEAGLRTFAAAAMLGVSFLILPPAYLLPKQDFEGALEYVLGARQAGDIVVTTGLTVLPYGAYYETGFPSVRSADELDRLLAEHDAVYVLHTLPIFSRSAAPDLAARLTPAGEVARFRGSLGDGDVVVYRFDGADALP